jgi:hypothetical protein
LGINDGVIKRISQQSDNKLLVVIHLQLQEIIRGI